MARNHRSLPLGCNQVGATDAELEPLFDRLVLSPCHRMRVQPGFVCGRGDVRPCSRGSPAPTLIALIALLSSQSLLPRSHSSRALLTVFLALPQTALRAPGGGGGEGGNYGGGHGGGNGGGEGGGGGAARRTKGKRKGFNNWHNRLLYAVRRTGSSFCCTTTHGPLFTRSHTKCTVPLSLHDLRPDRLGFLAARLSSLLAACPSPPLHRLSSPPLHRRPSPLLSRRVSTACRWSS